MVLKPNPYKTFLGFVEMTLICEEGGSSNVTVHAKDMEIDEASIQVEEMGGGKTFEVRLYTNFTRFCTNPDGFFTNATKFVQIVFFLAKRSREPTPTRSANSTS